MLTLHTADLMLPGGGREPVPGGAVLVEGRTIAALGPYASLAGRAAGARVRRWPGVLTPGLCQRHGTWLLTRCYHPDPREADVLGDRPLSGPALDALPMDPVRWAGSVRRGVQRMLRHGTTAVAIRRDDPVVLAAVQRVGLAVVPPAEPPAGAPDTPIPEPSLDPFAQGRGFDHAVHAPLQAGARADLAVFAVPADDDPYAALAAYGAQSCVATVLAGRLVHRAA